MKIRILQPTALRIEFKPGDEITVQEPSPALAALVNGERLDGEKVAQIIEGEEEYAVTDDTRETAVTGRGPRRREQRSAPVSE